MRVFELQSWFLSVLIKGFIKDKIDVDSNERKQMEELESRRRLLILQFEVQVRDAMELLSEQDFILEKENENQDEGAIEQKSTMKKGTNNAKSAVITSDMIQAMEVTKFAEPRVMLVNLCQRPELFKMVLRQSTIQDLEESIRTFDESLIEYFGLMIGHVESGYQELLEMTKPGGGLQFIMDRASLLHKDAEKIKGLIDCVRGWSKDFVGGTNDQHKKLQIVQKRIEIAVEKLSVAIRTESEISFASFMRDLATSFVCDGKCHEEDIPKSMI